MTKLGTVMLLVVLILLGTLSTIPVLNASPDILDVYWDEACTNPVTHINWGNLSRNSWTYKTVYLKHDFPVHLGVVWDVSNVIPENLFTYACFEVTPHEAPVLDTNEVREVYLCLYIYPRIYGGGGGFSFDIEVFSDVVSDVNKDRIVNGDDLMDVGLEMSEEPYEPYWNADFDKDGDVDFEDYSRFLLMYLSTYYKPSVCPYVPADIDEDLDCDFDDFCLFLEQYLKTYHSGWKKEDVNKDKMVNQTDYDMVGEDFWFEY